MSKKMKVFTISLFILCSFGIYGQRKQEKIDTIINIFKFAEHSQLQYKCQIEPLKHHAIGGDSIKLIELEDQLLYESVLKVVREVFYENFTDEEVDDIFSFIQSSAFKKMFNQNVIYKSINKHYSYIDKELEKIAERFDNSYKSSIPEFKPIPIDRKDGLYLTKDSIDPDTGVKEYVLYDSPSITLKDISEVKKISYDGMFSEVAIQLTKDATNKFHSLTKQNIGRPMAIVIADKIVAMPYINAAIIGGRIGITGRFSDEEIDQMIERLKIKE